MGNRGRTGKETWSDRVRAGCGEMCQARRPRLTGAARRAGAALPAVGAFAPVTPPGYVTVRVL